MQCSVKDYMPVINDSCSYITYKVIDKMETSTHTVFWGEVYGGEVFSDTDAMTYAYYHKVVKGKSPKTAPTYIPEGEEKREEEKTVRRFECQVCGHICVGKQAPEVCPVCANPQSYFQVKPENY